MSKANREDSPHIPNGADPGGWIGERQIHGFRQQSKGTRQAEWPSRRSTQRPPRWAFLWPPARVMPSDPPLPSRLSLLTRTLGSVRPQPSGPSPPPASGLSIRMKGRRSGRGGSASFSGRDSKVTGVCLKDGAGARSGRSVLRVGSRKERPKELFPGALGCRDQACSRSRAGSSVTLAGRPQPLGREYVRGGQGGMLPDAPTVPYESRVARRE